MVSTDSTEYLKVAIKYGANVPFLRSKQNSTDTAKSWDVVREVLNSYLKNGIKFDYVCLLQPTSPLRNEYDIRAAFSYLGEKVNNVVSVCELDHPIEWSFELSNTKMMEGVSKSPYINYRRQDLPKRYRENGAIYLIDATKIMDENYDFYSDNCMAFVMNNEKSLDIDTKEDIDFFDFYLYNSYKVK